MEEFNSSPYRAQIDPVDGSMPRPLWSVMIPTYNCADFLRETLESVLAQDPGPENMQIEVVDDCSREDDPQEVVREMAGERVGFFRQPYNVGHVQNFATCLQRSRGQLIHLLHGDDYVRDGFYERMGWPFERHSHLGAAFCRQIFANGRGQWEHLTSIEREAAGELEGAVERLAVRQRVQPPAMVVRRSVYERLGGFDRRIRWAGEDWEMWVRIASHYGVWYEPEPLAVYRIRKGSLMRTATLSGADTRDLLLTLELIEDSLQQFLPGAHVRRLIAEGRKDVARCALLYSTRLRKSGELPGALAQTRAAISASRTPRIVAGVAGSLMKAAKCRLTS